MNKLELVGEGLRVMNAFCLLNEIPAPAVQQVAPADWHVSACAYYRANVTRICVARCAPIGVAGPAWSFPGYVVDRTPYGVLQHELGHHVDFRSGTRKGAYWSEFSTALREQTGEEPITSYAPNNAEWFAEIFRLFVTNPDLLARIRPRTHREMISSRLKPLFSNSWRERLAGAPARTIAAAERKVEAAREGSLL